ncbi:hypothetical protein FOZ63_025457, partial [Perkinsus olseni]
MLVTCISFGIPVGVTAVPSATETPDTTEWRTYPLVGRELRAKEKETGEELAEYIFDEVFQPLLENDIWPSGVVSDSAPNIAAGVRIAIERLRDADCAESASFCNPATEERPPIFHQHCASHLHGILVRELLSDEGQFADLTRLAVAARALTTLSYPHRLYKGKMIAQIFPVRWLTGAAAIRGVRDNWNMLGALVEDLRADWDRLSGPTRIALDTFVEKLDGVSSDYLDEVCALLDPLERLNRELQQEGVAVMRGLKLTHECYSQLCKNTLLTKASRDLVRKRLRMIEKKRGFVRFFSPTSWQADRKVQRVVIKRCRRALRDFDEAYPGVLDLEESLSHAEQFLRGTGCFAKYSRSESDQAYWQQVSAEQRSTLADYLSICACQPVSNAPIERLFSSCKAVTKLNAKPSTIFRQVVLRWMGKRAIQREILEAAVERRPKSNPEGDILLDTSSDSEENDYIESGSCGSEASGLTLGTDSDWEDCSFLSNDDVRGEDTSAQPQRRMPVSQVRELNVEFGHDASPGPHVTGSPVRITPEQVAAEPDGLECIHHTLADTGCGKTSCTSSGQLPTRRARLRYFIYYPDMNPPTRSDSYTLRDLNAKIEEGEIVIDSVPPPANDINPYDYYYAKNPDSKSSALWTCGICQKTSTAAKPNATQFREHLHKFHEDVITGQTHGDDVVVQAGSSRVQAEASQAVPAIRQPPTYSTTVNRFFIPLPDQPTISLFEKRFVGALMSVGVRPIVVLKDVEQFAKSLRVLRPGVKLDWNPERLGFLQRAVTKDAVDFAQDTIVQEKTKSQLKGKTPVTLILDMVEPLDKGDSDTMIFMIFACISLSGGLKVVPLQGRTVDVSVRDGASSCSTESDVPLRLDGAMDVITKDCLGKLHENDLEVFAVITRSGPLLDELRDLLVVTLMKSTEGSLNFLQLPHLSLLCFVEKVEAIIEDFIVSPQNSNPLSDWYRMCTSVAGFVEDHPLYKGGDVAREVVGCFSSAYPTAQAIVDEWVPIQEALAASAVSETWKRLTRKKQLLHAKISGSFSNPETHQTALKCAGVLRVLTDLRSRFCEESTSLFQAVSLVDKAIEELTEMELFKDDAMLEDLTQR